MKKALVLGSIAAMVVLSACKKDRDPITPAQEQPTNLTVPENYVFLDENGNSTVSFNGQAQRLEMLSEMTTLMKTTNTSGVAINAQDLKDMYANEGITWNDVDGLGMTGSSKQLKNKTAAAPFGSADPAIQQQFESWMEDLALLSATTTTGVDNGGPGQGGVVVSTTNPSKQYLMNQNGEEYTQYIEKGLMGAVFYNQICQNYLGANEMASDNNVAVDPDNGKYYTEMEHAWDEAYGYFTTAIDFEAGGNGTDRFWGKYADGRESVLGSASTIAEAFRKGRAAIVAKDYDVRDAQIAIIRAEMERVASGTAIHYLNDALTNFGDDALRNHQLSEFVPFLSAIPYGYQPSLNLAEVQSILDMLGNDFYNVTTIDIIQVRDEVANATGLNDVKEQL